MKTVMPNIWMLLFRLVMLIAFIYMYQWPLEKFHSGDYQDNPLAFWFGLIFFSIFPMYLLWTLFGVLWITIIYDKSAIHFHYLYKTLKTTASNIDEYYRTTQKTKISSFRGVLIKLKTGKVVEVSEYNLKSIQIVNEFLATNKIPLKGDKISWFPWNRKK